MAGVEVVRNLPSCFVDKSLVQDLEAHLRRAIRRLPPDPEPHEDADLISVEISHEAGRETVRSIADYGPRTFPDGTHELALVCRMPRPDVHEIRVQFSVHRPGSFARVEHSGDAPPAFVGDFIAGVERMVAPKRTWNWWFSLDVGPSGLLDGLGLGVVVFATYAFMAGSRIPRWMLLVSLVLPLYRLIRVFKPYSAFESRQTRTFGAVGNLLTAGLAGLVFLTFLGAYFDINWLGF
jgi:hypothetical protein